MLALIDIPNIDRTLSEVLGHKPGREDRPDWAHIRQWLQDEADGDVEACAFANVSDPPAAAQARWLHHLRLDGYRVFARPRIAGSDIDQDMLDHLALRASAGQVNRVTVFSHDGRNFRAPLAALADQDESLEVTVVGFDEYTGWLLDVPELRFVDIEDIPGAFARRLPRTRLENLPATGAWLEPLPRAA